MLIISFIKILFFSIYNYINSVFYFKIILKLLFVVLSSFFYWLKIGCWLEIYLNFMLSSICNYLFILMEFTLIWPILILIVFMFYTLNSDRFFNYFRRGFLEDLNRFRLELWKISPKCDDNSYPPIYHIYIFDTINNVYILENKFFKTEFLFKKIKFNNYPLIHEYIYRFNKNTTIFRLIWDIKNHIKFSLNLSPDVKKLIMNIDLKSNFTILKFLIKYFIFILYNKLYIFINGTEDYLNIDYEYHTITASYIYPELFKCELLYLNENDKHNINTEEDLYFNYNGNDIIKIFIFLSCIITINFLIVFSFLSNFSTEQYKFISILLKINFFYNFDLIIGVDEISMMFITLTSFIFTLIFLSFYIQKNLKMFQLNVNFKDLIILLILTEIFLFLSFYSLNFFFFFFFFECSLIPLVLCINIWSTRNRKYYASYFLLFFTLLGSILLLAAILILFVDFKTLDISILSKEVISFNQQKILWILLFFGFAVKIPIIPFHIWLPEAHVEAPTVISVLLASVLLKIGSYGMLRFAIPLVKDAVIYYYPYFSIFSILSIILSTICAMLQVDLKKIIAYSSIAHMNYIVLALMTTDLTAINASIHYMLAHGFSSAALFFYIGIIYDRFNTKDLTKLNQINFSYPVAATFFFIFNLINISFPIFYSFLCEISVLIKLSQINFILILFMCIAIFLSVIYTFLLIHSINFGFEMVKYLKLEIPISKYEYYILIILLLSNFYCVLFGTGYFINLETALDYHLLHFNLINKT